MISDNPTMDKALGVAQTHLLFKKSETKNFSKPHNYAVLDESRVLWVFEGKAIKILSFSTY
ncbi:hypothetical protein SDC9_130139 [bioreactor metagenome]|uniref:Uncharacterized protein n=1 Tax=bioreactor metagenome TaxID=1076179 RepID=A0A645D0X7_9ZZZZ